VSQEDIYNEVGPIILDNVYQGYNACLFAYGQTGAGKSYTMMGGQGSRDQWGIIPRLCEGLYERMTQETTGREYNVKVSYVEIYCEQLRDLLSSKAKAGEIRVRDHPKYGPYIDGANLVICGSLADIKKVIAKGDGNRVTAQTNMNDTSSRSHAVFSVIFEQFKQEGGKARSWLSKINLVDLAGSERVSLTGAEGQTFEEGKKINMSLTMLGRVIDALVDLSNGKKGVIPPYRDSMLTRVLQDSLGGNSKTMMFANISPAPCNYGDTINTLQYASRARKIINKAHVNTDSSGAMIDNLNAELEALRAQLANSSGEGSAEQAEEIDHLQQQLEQQTALISRLKSQAGEVDEAQQAAKAAQAEVEDLTAKVADMEGLKGELKQSEATVQQKTAQLRDMQDDLDKQKKTSSEMISKLQGEVSNWKSKAESTEKKLGDATKKAAEDNANSRSQISKLEAELSDCKRNVADLEKAKRRQADELEDRSRQISDLQSDVRDYKRRVDDLEHERSDLLAENNELQTQLRKYRSKWEDEHEANGRLKDQVDKYISEVAVLKKQLERERNERRSTEGRLDSERRRAGDFLSNLANLEEQVHRMNVRETNYAERTLSPERSRDRQNGVNSCIANQKELIRSLQKEKQDAADALHRYVKDLESAIRDGDNARSKDILAKMRRSGM